MFEEFNKIEKPELLNPLVLAYIGDAIYEVYVRNKLVSQHNIQVDKLHKMAVNMVKSSAQAKSYHKIEQELTEEELAVFKRGRNAKSSVPKNSDMSEYKIATGLEALIGYIYLSGDNKRLDEIMNLILREE